jgi:glycosyltransferase involved in cell wall biosynthesis
VHPASEAVYLAFGLAAALMIGRTHSLLAGLPVVNNTTHVGVPCLVSDRVGCQRDLITDGETGWGFPAADPAALTAALARALARHWPHRHA